MSKLGGTMGEIYERNIANPPAIERAIDPHGPRVIVNTWLGIPEEYVVFDSDGLCIYKGPRGDIAARILAGLQRQFKTRGCCVCGDLTVLTIGYLNPGVGPFCGRCHRATEELRKSK